MTRRTKTNIFIALILILLTIYFYFNLNYYDRYLLKQSSEERLKNDR